MFQRDAYGRTPVGILESILAHSHKMNGRSRQELRLALSGRRRWRRAIRAVVFIKALWRELEERTHRLLMHDWLVAKEMHGLSDNAQGIFMIGWEARHANNNYRTNRMNRTINTNHKKRSRDA